MDSEENAKAIIRLDKENKRLQAEIKKLKDVFGQDEPWSLLTCMKALVLSSQHLLNDHNCDTHGYERTEIAMKQTDKYIAKLEQVLKEK